MFTVNNILMFAFAAQAMAVPAPVADMVEKRQILGGLTSIVGGLTTVLETVTVSLPALTVCMSLPAMTDGG